MKTENAKHWKGNLKMKLFNKNKDKNQVGKNTVRVTAIDNPNGTILNLEVNDKLTNEQFVRVIPNLLLNIALDFIVRYNIDINEFLNNFNADMKRSHHEMIKKMGEGK